jgi:hypothetical protein
MGKLIISKELSDKISKSLKIKQSDIVDSGANKPIIRNCEYPKKESPVKSPYESPKQNSPVKSFREELPQNSPIKTSYKSPVKEFHVRPPREYSPVKRQLEHPISYPKKSDKSHKSNKSNKQNKLNYMKISKIVFISSIVGGIGITLGIKLGAILFL